MDATRRVSYSNLTQEQYAAWLERCALSEPAVALTFDTDECPQFAVDMVLEALDAQGLPGTFFCDTKYDLTPGHEAGIHPHVRDPLGPDGVRAVDDALELVPGAVGCRVHCMISSGGLVYELAGRGVRYDSSLNAPLMPGIAPLPQPAGLVLMPAYFMEGQWFRFGLLPKLPDDLLTPGLKIFGFHPVSLWHNLGPDTFAALRAMAQAKRYTPELVQPGFGVWSYFLKLLRTIREQGVRCATVADLTPRPPGAGVVLRAGQDEK